MIPSEDIMSIVKNTMNASIHCNTIRNYIGRRSCDNICMDMHDCLNMLESPFDRGDYLTVLEAADYILVTGVKLASCADSSSGMLTDVVLCTFELIERCTLEIAKQDKQLRDAALGMILKEAKKKAFDGWPDWRYDLMKYAICLCDEKNAKKFENTLDAFMLELEKEDFPQYRKKEILVVRFLLHRHLYGKEAMREELYKHLDIKELCIIAINDAVEAQNFDEAERLCIEKANKDDTWNYRRHDPKDWNNILFDIYIGSGNIEKQICQARKILLYGNEDFWDTLKELYKKQGTWAEVYSELLDELKNSSQSVCYKKVLVKENEKQRLLEDVTEKPYDLFYYGKYLVKDYPKQIYDLCYKVITESCTQAKDRREYKKVTKQIAQLIKWKGKDTARDLIAELKQTYPRKPALIDELEKVEQNL